MTDSTLARVLGERLIDAREAAHCLNLPLYLLTHPKERRRLAVPHYRVGKLVRYRPSELALWAARNTAVQSRESVDRPGTEEGTPA